MIYLFLVCLCVNLISANPLTKLLLQSRSNCNQNGYNSYNVPIQANNQPYAPPVMVQNTMTSYPNNQPFGLQNELPVQIKLEDTNQSYLNKILANPMLQNILNRNNNNFNQNNIDNAIPASQAKTPNIVNNYYIIPPECLQGKEDAVEIVRNLIGNQAQVCQNDDLPKQKSIDNERNNLQNSHNRQNEGRKRRPDGNKRPRNQENGSVKNRNNNNAQKRKRKNGHQNQNRRGNNQENRRSNKQDQNMNRNVNNKNPDSVRIKDEKNLQRKRNGTQESQARKNGNKKRKRPKSKSDNENVDNLQQISNDTISTKNYTIPNEAKSEPNKLERKTKTDVSGKNKDEVIIKDIHNKFPGIPEDVVRRLLGYLKRQLKNQLLDSNIECKQIQNTNRDRKRRKNSRINQNKHRESNNDSVLIEVTEPVISVTTDNSLDTSTMIEINDRDRKRRKNSRINQNKHRKSKNDSVLTEVTEPVISVTTDNSLDTSTMIEINETLNNQEEKSTKYNNKQEYATEQKMLETTTTSDLQTPKLGEEDKILDSENDVDDYFPDFRFDKMYMSEDDYIRSLRDNRFYYTTDRSSDSEKNNKNEESSEIYYEPYEPTGSKKVDYELQSHEIEDTIRRPDKDFNDNYGEVVVKNYSGEEIEFQTPPILEFPDFETKPILKYFDVEGPIYFKPETKNLDDVNDKSSTYSVVKSINTPMKIKPKSDNIETVFARSKVAKYGQHEEFEDDALDMNKNSKYDDTMFVYAKSYSDS